MSREFCQHSIQHSAFNHAAGTTLANSFVAKALAPVPLVVPPARLDFPRLTQISRPNENNFLRPNSPARTPHRPTQRTESHHFPPPPTLSHDFPPRPSRNSLPLNPSTKKLPWEISAEKILPHPVPREALIRPSALLNPPKSSQVPDFFDFLRHAPSVNFATHTQQSFIKPASSKLHTDPSLPNFQSSIFQSSILVVDLTHPPLKFTPPNYIPAKPEMPAAARPDPKSAKPAPATPPQTDKLTLQQWLATRVNGASLGMFRIFFGIVMLLEAISITRPMASAHGSIPLVTYFTSPDITYHLPYAPFQWLPLFSPGIIKLIVAVLGIASVALAAGLFHRLAASLVFLTWGYLYVVESTRTYWMSYYYLELLVSFLIIWVPADRRYSLKSLFTSAKSGPKSTSPTTDSTVPYWSILILQLQLVITYFYAGVAKLNADWLLDAQPVKRFLADASIGAPQALQPLLGSLSFAYFLSWTGALFDLAVGFLLLARRTRLLGFVALLIFHSTNHFLLFKDIVWFPLLGALSATIFLNPDWPERFIQWLRKPRFPKPDLKWLVPGALLLPGLGATLGWKARLTAHFASAAALSRLGIALFAAWLAIQIIVPLRHYFIPGDARVSFEGLAFSWRLKAEFYGVEAAKLTVHDTNFLSTASDKSSTIHWDRWPGDKTFYRFLKRGQINWTNLPEIVVTFEPGIGERIFFNPVSGGRTQGTDEQSMARIQEIWRERFGREAKGISRTFALNEILEGYGRALQSRGFPVPSASTPDGLRDLMNGLLNDRSMAGLVRRTHPFATARASTADHNFMIIEDASLLKAVAITQSQVDRSAWKTGPEQSAPGDSIAHNGPPALPLHLLDDSPESIALLQQVAILTHAADPNTPRIHWNYYKDGTASKAMHVSTNPFLLRRYARRVSALWEKQYGRYPKVTALTGLALNTRPMQQTVDPNADLASVPIARFGHNPWINDLKLERILKSKPAQHDQSIKLGITAR